MVCLDRQKPTFANYSSPTLSPLELVAGCYAPTSASAIHLYPGYEPVPFAMKTEPPSSAFASMMAYSTPSPSDTSSNWSQKPSESSHMPATAFWPGHDSNLTQPAKPSISEDTRIKIECSYRHESIFSSMATPGSDTSDMESVVDDDDDEAPAPDKKKSLNDDDSREREALFLKYKDLIVQLYYRMKLVDVQHIMETEHNLRASGRMYKQRLKVWGVEKNVTIGMVQRCLQMLFDGIRRALAQEKPRHLLSGPNTTLLLDVGYFDVVKIQKYVKRNSDGLKKMRDASDRSLDLLRSLTPEGGPRSRNVGEPGRARLSMPTARLVQILNLQASQRAAHFSISMPSQPRRNTAQQFHPGVADPSFQSPAVYTMSSSPAQVLQWPAHGSSRNNHSSHAAMTLLGPSAASPMNPLAWGDLTAAPTTVTPTSALTAMSSPLEPMASMQMALPFMWMDQHSLRDQAMLDLGHNHDGSMPPPW